VGALCLRKQQPVWMLKIWHLVYGCLLLLLVLSGLYDWMIARSSMDVRIIAYDLQELLISPTFYVGIVLMSRFSAVKK
jgi:hypothetical protein